jgi:hypothetical protein
LPADGPRAGSGLGAVETPLAAGPALLVPGSGADTSSEV